MSRSSLVNEDRDNDYQICWIPLLSPTAWGEGGKGGREGRGEGREGGRGGKGGKGGGEGRGEGLHIVLLLAAS